MAKLFLSIFLVLAVCMFFCNCKSKPNLQSNKDSIEFIKRVKQKKLSDTNSIEYVKQCVEFIKQVKHRELSDTNFILVDKPSWLHYLNCINSVLADTAIFTKEELNFIKNKEFVSISKWTKEMFPNIKIISSDTLATIFASDSDGWNYFYKNIGEGFCTFSIPIFLRNNTYCLFYFDEHCGSLCGGGSLDLYKKENGKWVIIKSYCSWVS